MANERTSLVRDSVSSSQVVSVRLEVRLEYDSEYDSEYYDSEFHSLQKQNLFSKVDLETTFEDDRLLTCLGELVITICSFLKKLMDGSVLSRLPVSIPWVPTVHTY